MTDAEILNLAQAEIEILSGISEWGITVLTGYLLIAYVVGKNLTFFQVGFVNLVFIILVLTSLDSTIASQNLVGNLMELLHQQNPELAMQTGYDRINAPSVTILRRTITAVMAVGALLFMWSVRHPK